MTENPASFTLEQQRRLCDLARQSAAGDGPLTPEDAAALRALLDVNEWFGLVKQVRYHVAASEDRVVRLTVSGIQYVTTHASVPMEMPPELAEKLAEELESAASFARMAITFDPDAIKGEQAP